MHCLPSPTWARPLPAGRCVSLVRASAHCAPWGKLDWPVLTQSLWPHGGIAGTLLRAKVGSSPTWKPSFSEIFLRAAFQEEQFCGHTVMPAYARTKDMMGIIHQVKALAFWLGMNCLQQSMKYHLYVFFLLWPPKLTNFCPLHTLIPFRHMQPIFGFSYDNPLYKKQIMEYIIFMRFHSLAPKVTTWINVLCGSVLQHELSNC